MSGSSVALDAVERRASARPACARRTTIAPPGEPLEIERVHRLAELEHHVVGDVDDVVDRPDAGGLEPVAQPRGDGPTVTSNTCAQ